LTSGGSRKRERPIQNSSSRSGDDCNEEDKIEEESCFVKICAGNVSKNIGKLGRFIIKDFLTL
jgi:hypothetical protein